MFPYAAALLCCLLSTLSFAQSPSARAATATADRAAITVVNINTADAATLARHMEGIGESKARAIVEHRQRNGAFRSVDELALVKGIGKKTLERNRSRLTVGATKTPPAAVGASGRATGSAPR